MTITYVYLNCVCSGPHMKLLKDGETVTLANGKIIHPDDVLEPAEPNHPFLGLFLVSAFLHSGSLVYNTKMHNIILKRPKHFFMKYYFNVLQFVCLYRE